MKRVLMMLLAMLPAWSGFGAEHLALLRTGDRYTLEAVAAPLSEILFEIEDIEGVEIRPFGFQDRLVTATYEDVTLGTLLRRLEVSYVLVYDQNAEGDYVLGGAWALGQGQPVPPLDPELEAQIRKYIGDLHDDDVHWNAHYAQTMLMSIGCAAVPLLEEALHSEDYQARHLAAQIIRSVCPEHVPSQRMLDVTLDLLRRDGYKPGEYWSIFSPTSAFLYLLQQTNQVHLIRPRLVNNLDSEDGQERFTSAVLLAHHGERHMAERLVRQIAPHLMDNRISSDGGMAARALFQLGPVVMPYLERYLNSDDWQQADFVDLVYRSLQNGRIEEPTQRLYIEAGYVNPLKDTRWPRMTYWNLERFPDRNGRYPESAR